MTKHFYKILSPFSVYNGKVITKKQAQSMRKDIQATLPKNHLAKLGLSQKLLARGPISYSPSEMNADYFDYDGNDWKITDTTRFLEENGYIKKTKTQKGWGKEQPEDNSEIFKKIKKEKPHLFL